MPQKSRNKKSKSKTGKKLSREENISFLVLYYRNNLHKTVLEIVLEKEAAYLSVGVRMNTLNH